MAASVLPGRAGSRLGEPQVHDHRSTTRAPGRVGDAGAEVVGRRPRARGGASARRTAPARPGALDGAHCSRPRWRRSRRPRRRSASACCSGAATIAVVAMMASAEGNGGTGGHRRMGETRCDQRGKTAGEPHLVSAHPIPLQTRPERQSRRPPQGPLAPRQEAP